MRGRHVLMESFVSHGVRHIFGNPGTTETPLLDSLPAFPQIEYIMALHEGVAASAASFYAQASGRVTVANLHVAPGLGNGIGSLYGALKANSPVVVTAGQQDTRMRLKNPLLGHDLVAMAAPVTKWSVQIERADEIAPIMRRAFKVATDAPQGPVFVSLPIDVMEQETAVDASTPDNLWRSTRPDPAGVEALATLLLKSKKPAIIAGDDVARSASEQALVALAETIGATVWFEGLRHHAPFPTSHPSYRQSLPGDARQVRQALGDTDLVLLIGGPFFEDIWFCAGWPHCRRRVPAADRSFRRTSRTQQPARCRHRRRHRRQPPRIDGSAARKGGRGLQAGHANPQCLVGRIAGERERSLSRARREELGPSAQLDAARHRGTSPRATRECRHRR
jgi:benzoylformate decarboxylase